MHTRVCGRGYARSSYTSTTTAELFAGSASSRRVSSQRTKLYNIQFMYLYIFIFSNAQTDYSLFGWDLRQSVAAAASRMGMLSRVSYSWLLPACLPRDANVLCTGESIIIRFIIAWLPHSILFCILHLDTWWWRRHPKHHSAITVIIGIFDATSIH